jgi:hypothetical protein
VSVVVIATPPVGINCIDQGTKFLDDALGRRKHFGLMPSNGMNGHLPPLLSGDGNEPNAVSDRPQTLIELLLPSASLHRATNVALVTAKVNTLLRSKAAEIIEAAGHSRFGLPASSSQCPP